MIRVRLWPALVLALLLAAPTLAQDSLTLCAFETPADVKAWDYVAGSPTLVTEGVTQGTRALQITFDPKGRYQPAYIYWRRPRRDWSAYDAIVLDVTNPGDAPIRGYVLIADQAWRDKNSSYWNRHNASTTFAPGRTRWVIPVRGLYRGEAGSRNNDIKRNIDPDQIIRVDFGFGKKGSTGRVIIDNLRLVRGRKPDGAWAFDFGPASQSVMLGWTGVSHETRYTKQRGFGWGPRGGAPWNGAARDTTFGPAVLRDFCEAGGCSFHVDVPPGEYKVVVFFENSGYWGGEQAKHSRRWIEAGGKEVWHEDRRDGSAHALWRFENVEPVGKDIWDTYMAGELARPAVFRATAGPAGLTVRIRADKVWGAKIAGILLYKANNLSAAKWVADQLKAVEKAFRDKAVCLDKPPAATPTPPAWRDRRVVAWPVAISDTITPHTLPPADAAGPQALKLSARVARGESEALCLAVRSMKWGEGPVNVDFAWHGKKPAPRTEVHSVWYNTSRGFNTIAYRIMPHTLRRARGVMLAPRVTRELVVKVHVSPNTAPGVYQGLLKLTHGGEALVLEVPVEVRVADVVLDRDTPFRMGFFGLMPPDMLPAEKRWETLARTLAMLKDYGMNMVTGGPSWRLTGWKDGRPIIDYGEADRFFALLRQHGFTGPLNGYGGPRFRGLHDGYQKGASGAKAERESGLSYQDALLTAWGAVAKHAREHHWPTLWYAMCDETRVREVAERELAFMKMMARVSATFPQTVRTAGSYSVHFRSRPTDKNDMLYWHQRFFETLDISSLNLHDPSVTAEAAKLGRQVHIYNQGRTRYSFGLYQWSEFRKGIRSRTQWHLRALHGYQFFDLDGREPDTAMICYGRREIYPTIHFERCREGAEDFYLIHTLAKRLQAAKARGANAATARAEALLRKLESSVKLNQRTPPEGYNAQKMKQSLIEALAALK